MSAQVYIIGTKHEIQTGGSGSTEAQRVAFDEEIRRQIAQHGIKRLAEEISGEGLAYYEVSQTIGERIAEKLQVLDQPVDLSREMRSCLAIQDGAFLNSVKALQIEDAQNFRKAFDHLAGEVRERVWVARILSQTEWPVLFICGADHVESVRRLFECLGVQVEVLHSDYSP